MCIKLLLRDLNPGPYPPHSTSTYGCGVWGIKAGVQVSKREFHTHIHLDYVKVEFYLVSKKKKNLYILEFHCEKDTN